jgi:hypothetical protein
LAPQPLLWGDSHPLQARGQIPRIHFSLASQVHLLMADINRGTAYRLGRPIPLLREETDYA